MANATVLPSPTADRAAPPITLAAGELTLTIGRPWSLEASVGGRPLFRLLPGAERSTPYGGLAYQRAGSTDWQHATGVEGVAALPNGQRLTLTTTEPGVGVGVLEATAVAPGVARLVFTPPEGGAVAWAGLSAASDSQETLLGLGERFDGVDLAGKSEDLWIADRREVNYGSSTYLAAPWLLSSRGFGFLLDDSRRSTWELRSRRADSWAVRVAAPLFAAYLIAGTPATALDRYTALTGRPPNPPAWSFGVVKTLVGGEERVLADAARLRDAKVPVDGIFMYDVVDQEANIGWPGVPYDAIKPGPYPDVRRLTAELRRMGFRPLAYFSPDFRPERSSYAAAARQGFLVKGKDGKPWVSPLYKISNIDATNPAAMAWWRDNLLRRALVDLGFDGGMFDLGEAVPADAQFAGGLTGVDVHNRFPAALAQTLTSAVQTYKTDGLFWLRSGYTGAQRYELATWSGDPVHNWAPVSGFPSVLPAALGAGLAGFAYWHTEVGGFVDGGLTGQADRELYLRWLELGAFTSMLRDQYGDRRGHPTDIWTDAATLGLWRRYARIHQALRPYLERSAAQASAKGLPLLRHLALAFPDDARAWAEQQQFLLGDDLLVAPVVTAGAVTRDVYLPAGEWVDWWTGRRYAGPSAVTVPAPLDRIPVFSRGDASPLPPAATFTETS